MSGSNPQTQSFGEIALSGQGNNLTISQTIQIGSSVVKDRPFVAASPYLGLHRFEEEHRDLFFGRDALVTELFTTVSSCPFTLVLGASGSGKSSLVRAGLIPLLRQRMPKLRVYSFVPDRDPFDALRAALVHGGGRHQDADAAYARQPDTLLAMCKNPRLKRPGEPWLLFVDQLEEIFTRLGDVALCAAFLEGIVRLSEAAPPEVRLCAAMRADFFDRFDPYPRLLRLVKSNWQPVTSPDTSALRLCIEQPAAYHGVLFEEGLVDTILRDVADQPGGLPLLQYTLDRLWQEDAPTETRRMLRRDSYHRLGGARGALRQRADALYDYRDSINQEPRPPEQKEALRRLFLRMVDLSDTAENARPVSQRIPMSELAADESQLIAELADEKLVVTARSEEGVATVEVVHEALLNGWPQMQLWIAQAREVIFVRNRLLADARTWQAAQQAHRPRAEEDLWRGSRLAQAREMAQRGDFDRILGGLNAAAAEFLAASLAEQDRQAELEQKRQQALADALHHARAQQHLAEQRELDMYVEQGRQLLVEKQQPVDALLWLQRAYERGSHHAMLPYLLADAMRSVDAVRAVLRGHGEWINQSRLSPDGRRVITASDDQTACIWDAETGACLAVLHGHTARVVDACFSPDGRRVVTASQDQTARIWDAESFALRAVLTGHVRGLRAVRVSPDSRLIVTASIDQTAQIWDAETGRSLFVLQGHGDLLTDAGFSPDGQLLVTASLDKTARIWDVKTGKLISVLRGHADQVWQAEWSPDGKRVVTSGRDKTARLWSAETGAELLVLDGHESVVNSASFSPDGAWVVTASTDHTARIFSSATGKQHFVLKGHHDWVQQASYSPDGQYIVTASCDHTARTFDARTGKPIMVLQGHTGRLVGAVFGPDNRCILTASQDRTARVWSARAGQSQAILQGHGDAVNYASFSADGRRVVTASSDSLAQIWDVETGQPLCTLRGHSTKVGQACFSPDGLHVATASSDTRVGLWSAETGKPVAVLRGHTYWVKKVSFSPDGRYILTLSGGGLSARLWDGKTGQPLRELRGHHIQISDARFSPDGRRVVTASRDLTARLWDAETGAELFVLRGHEGVVDHAGFSPCGRWLGTASRDRSARLWEVETGCLVAVLRGHSEPLCHVSYSPDGERVLTASADQTARLWSAKTGQPLAILQGHNGRVTDAQFSPDGRRILTMGQDTTVRLFETETAKLLRVLQGHSAALNSACFSPDGRLIVTTSEDGTARLWNVAAESRDAAALGALITARVPLKLEGSVIVGIDSATRTFPL